MKTIRNLSGVYFRAKNAEDKWDNICFEDLEIDKQNEILQTKEKEWLISLCRVLADTINQLGELGDFAKE